MYVCMYVCMYACMHVCMYACMHVCMYACKYICMYYYYIYIYIHNCFMYIIYNIVYPRVLAINPSVDISIVED